MKRQGEVSESNEKRQKLNGNTEVLVPSLDSLPLSLKDINSAVVDLLHAAAASLTKQTADAARESTFEYLQSSDIDTVELYTPVYATSQLLYAQCCYNEGKELIATQMKPDGGDTERSRAARECIVKSLDECLRAVDLAILRTNVGEWTQAAKPLLQAAESLRSSVFVEDGDDLSTREQFSVNSPKDGQVGTILLTAPSTTVQHCTNIPSKFLSDTERGSEIPRIDASQLSVEEFLVNYISSEPPTPVILCNAMTTWPALRKWCDMDYLKKRAAERLVPVEIYDAKDASQTYLTDTWQQQVMSFGDYMDNFLLSEDKCDNERGYLAQYQLFEQIPSLMDDICMPCYCTALADEDLSAPQDSECTPPPSPIVSAWFGPKGTVSPLHNDPYHNLLAQVVGSKYLRLYRGSDTQCMYPRAGPMCNNSNINLDEILENPTEPPEQFPLFHSAKFQHCILRAGEILYIPRHYWHYVRSLEMSFSTSFWWGAKMALIRVDNGDNNEEAKYIPSY